MSGKINSLYHECLIRCNSMKEATSFNDQQILFLDLECSEKDLDKNKTNLKKNLHEFERERVTEIMGNDTYSIKVTFENGLTTTFNNIASHEEKDGVLHIKYVRDITFPKENIKSIEKLDNREDD